MKIKKHTGCPALRTGNGGLKIFDHVHLKCVVHTGIDAVLIYFFKKSTVWRPFDLELPNFGQIITTHMASL